MKESDSIHHFVGLAASNASHYENLERCALPRRPMMKYHGGKWRIAPWILSFFPNHKTYVEPYGGAASVLLQKSRSAAEIYNDIDGDVVNVLRVLRNPTKATRLKRAIELTPYSRTEFNEAYVMSGDDVEQARKTIIKSFMGYGSASATRPHKSGFRSIRSNAGALPADEWLTWPFEIAKFVQRLQGVVLENRDAIAVMRQYDESESLFYVDPPYLWDTRSSLGTKKRGSIKHAYKSELSDEDHIALGEYLKTVRAMVIVSGYLHPLYACDLYSSWYRYEIKTLADCGKTRREAIWLNDACVRALCKETAQRDLFRN